MNKENLAFLAFPEQTELLLSELAGRFGIMSIPSFLFIKDGKVVNSSVGGMSPDMLSSKIDTLLQA